MKRLVTFFSRTRHNQLIAQQVAEAIGAEIDEIHDEVNRQGRAGWIRAGKDAMLKKTTRIQVSKDPKEYDQIILGGPKWAFNLIPPLRSYASRFNFEGKKIALFSVCLSGDTEKIFSELADLLVGSEVTNTLTITDRQLKREEYHLNLNDFIANI